MLDTKAAMDIAEVALKFTWNADKNRYYTQLGSCNSLHSPFEAFDRGFKLKTK